MPDYLINGSYPQEYWNLPNIDEELGSYELWWSSEERVKTIAGEDTSEYLEIDYGRKRVSNYISFDITRKPVDITIEYDAWSHGDRSLGSRWVAVTPVRELPGREGTDYDNFVSYTQGANIAPWEHVQFFFTDGNGEAVATQRFRIRFRRRESEFPRQQGLNPSWSIDVRNLRSARYIVDLQDARGILVESGDWSDSINLGVGASVEVRQGFRMPGGYIRSPQGGFLPPPRDEVITEMVPSIVGVGFFVGGPGSDSELIPTDESGNTRPVRYFWSLYDVTEGTNKLLRAGIASQVMLAVRGWIDVLFQPDDPIATEAGRLYQIRLRSADTAVSNEIYIKKGNPLRDFAEEDTTEIDVYTLADVDATEYPDTAILFRVWGDIGESGKDIFGNEYREGVRRDQASNVKDNTLHTNWISGPNPDPAAVECLYFDVRTLNELTNEYQPSIVDSVKVNPITPGVFMTAYYSNDNHKGNAPLTVDYPNGWEGLRWVPVVPPNHPYQLLREQTFNFPYPVRASWICLEFTSLQPLPFRLNEFPELPPIRYKKFPDSVYSRLVNNQVTHDDYLPDPEEKVQIDLFSFFQVSDEFNYRSYTDGDINFITKKTSIGSANAPVSSGAIDSRTLAQIYFNGTSLYYSSLPTKTDQTTALGQYVASSYSFGNMNYAQAEIPTSTSTGQRRVSNVNNRDTQAYQTQQEVIKPLWFPQIERHPYSTVYGRFASKKAYFAGIAEVQFLRRDYTVERDDKEIKDVLADTQLIDSPLVDFNTWTPEIPSTIPEGATLWVSYTVGPVRYEEFLQFEVGEAGSRNFEPVLLTRGGGRAVNVEVWSGQNKVGTKFILSTDYDLIYDEELAANYIQRNSLHYRLVSTNIKVYEDIITVIGRGVVSSVDGLHTAKVGTAKAVMTARSGLQVNATYRKTGAGVMAFTAKGYKVGIASQFGILVKKAMGIVEFKGAGDGAVI